MFGLKSATAIKQESHKKRDLIKTILLKELNRSFKFSEAVRDTHFSRYHLGLPSAGLQRQGLRGGRRYRRCKVRIPPAIHQGGKSMSVISGVDRISRDT